jgi:hypothetical protein
MTKLSGSETVEEHEDVRSGIADSGAKIWLEPIRYGVARHDHFEFRHEIRQASAGGVWRCRLVHNRTVLVWLRSLSTAWTDELGVERVTG